jgi:gentisate 1,2-dioxygenase
LGVLLERTQFRFLTTERGQSALHVITLFRIGPPVRPDGTRRVRYINPLAGGSAMALLDSELVQIDAADESVSARTNTKDVCVVTEGE